MKKYLAIGLIAFLLLPIIQGSVPYFKLWDLKGAITPEQDIQFKWPLWHNEEYQKQKSKFLNQEFGFRNYMVRLNNQLYFWIYKMAKANGVVIGKDNYLYEVAYIDAYTGKDFRGDSALNANVNDLIEVKKLLEKLNKKLIIVFSPGKASYYPEYIPDRYLKGFNTNTTSTNYKSYRKKIIDAGLPFIDFNDWFVKNKNTSPYPLYPKTGIHWSSYGAVLASDSISAYIGSMQAQETARVYWTEFANRDSVGEVDTDIENGMNLLLPIDKPHYVYPICKYETVARVKPRTLVISDSFYWNIYNTTAGGLYEKPVFAFYYAEWFGSWGGKLYRNQINLKEQINNTDAIIIMATEAQLRGFPFGFSEDILYEYGINTSGYLSKVDKMITDIKNNPEWLAAVTKKASEKGLPLDQVIKEDAIFVLRNK